MNSLKRAIPWVVAFGLITGCAPIDGLGNNEDEMAKTTTIEVTTTPPETTELRTTAPATTEPMTEAPTTIVANWIKVNADALNVRETASLTAKRLAKVYDGMVYAVLAVTEDEEGKTWYKIKATNEVTGWVSGDYAIPGENYEDLQEE